MDELINLVVEKTGISNDQAKKAVEVVMGFLKDKLPPPIAGQIDGLLAGGKNPVDMLGGFLGKK